MSSNGMSSNGVKLNFGMMNTTINNVAFTLTCRRVLGDDKLGPGYNGSVCVTARNAKNGRTAEYIYGAGNVSRLTLIDAQGAEDSRRTWANTVESITVESKHDFRKWVHLSPDEVRERFVPVAITT